MVLLLGVALVAAGCSGPGNATSAPSAARPGTAPGCGTQVAPAGKLAAVRTVMLALPGSPFGVVTTPNGAWSFVSACR
ncbi:MAG: hypothetical protein JO287_06825 [Pseudonocardiales bacterium]|nr:hypothetical protein [Pseudonocardiales bacterium]